MYELSDYLAMVEDPVRTPAYLAAIRAVVRPGDRVLEIGSGFGYFAVAAALAGAAVVIAVEPNDVIAHGRALAEANGCAERIRFIQARADQVVLDVRADILLEDLRGISPLHGARLEVLRDAHARLLVPGARVIPHRDVLLLAPSALPDDLARLSDDAPAALHGISIVPVRAAFAQAVHRTHGGADSLLASAAAWATLEYAALAPGEPNGSAEWVVERDGVLAGLLSWFAATLAPGIGYDTAPASGRTVYDRGFLPIGAPIAVHAGDTVKATVRTRFDGQDHVWAWDVVVSTASGVVRRQGSNLASLVISAARRARRAAAHVPPRDRFVDRLLALAIAVDGERSLGEIAARMRTDPSVGFADEQSALRWAAELLARSDEDART